ncbi:hypothetical protein CHARACLAT_027953, partial [Characodon lateralis]|nr:hypothetical protein [Characodon lateralis]
MKYSHSTNSVSIKGTIQYRCTQHPETTSKMLLLLLLVTSCSAIPNDLSNKMFTFPQETNTAHVRLTTSRQNLRAVTVCFSMVTNFEGLDFKLNKWHSICATWDSTSGLVQLWLDGEPSNRKFTSSGSNINGPIIVALGQ